MRHGFVKVAAATPDLRVADCAFNCAKICEQAQKAADLGAKIVVFPELCVTGYTCGDLFAQEILLSGAKEGLREVLKASKAWDALVFVGLPWEARGKLYNVAAALSRGRLLGLVPKRHLPNYAEFYEARNFTPGSDAVTWVDFDGAQVPFGTQILFSCRQLQGLLVAAEICEDLWVPNPPSVRHAMAGAAVVANLSASDENTGKADYREKLVAMQSARLLCGYVYAGAGDGESTTDLVFAGHSLIAENGVVLAQSQRFSNGIVASELDIHRLRAERRRMTTFARAEASAYVTVPFDLQEEETALTRSISPWPFLPPTKEGRARRMEEILQIQAHGLKKRLIHTGVSGVVVGVSGGLDSTLALLVAARAMDLAGQNRSGILGVTMPCFGTTDRTYQNACRLTEKLGATLLEIPIRVAVRQHFRDIGQDPEKHDVTYENSQARERTQVLMDIANQRGALVVGTGDLSELALGWATYNGDHMSMYAVNASIPKTLVRYLVGHWAETCGDASLANALRDILETPVSPELLPPKDGVISQRTEELVGPYELHDFFLYHMLRLGEEPSKIYRLAKYAFASTYGADEIRKWMRTFYRRFFSQQFKRSCMPDGPRVGSVAVSPRGDLRMPSDACAELWLAQIEDL